MLRCSSIVNPTRQGTRVLRVCVNLVSFFSLVALLSGCDEPDSPQPMASKSRSDAVIAAAPQPAAENSSPAQPKPPGSVPAPAGPLCTPGAKGTLPDQGLFRVERDGSTSAAPALSRGRPYFLSFWAAWCEPCKKELPLLVAWRRKLHESGLVGDAIFISLDDDKRQLTRYLTGQSHLDGTLHLPEGDPRTEYLRKLDLPEDPRLPVQVIVDSEGEVACRIEGAVEEADLAKIGDMLRKL